MVPGFHEMAESFIRRFLTTNIFTYTGYLTFNDQKRVWSSKNEEKISSASIFSNYIL